MTKDWSCVTGLTAIGMGGCKAENLRCCCREHSSLRWWAGQASGTGEKIQVRKALCRRKSSDSGRTTSWAVLQIFIFFLMIYMPYLCPGTPLSLDSGMQRPQCSEGKRPLQGIPCSPKAVLGEERAGQDPTGKGDAVVPSRGTTSTHCAVKSPTISLPPCFLLRLLMGLFSSSLFRHAVLIPHRVSLSSLHSSSQNNLLMALNSN